MQVRSRTSSGLLECHQCLHEVKIISISDVRKVEPPSLLPSYPTFQCCSSPSPSSFANPSLPPVDSSRLAGARPLPSPWCVAPGCAPAPRPTLWLSAWASSPWGPVAFCCWNSQPTPVTRFRWDWDVLHSLLIEHTGGRWFVADLLRTVAPFAENKYDFLPASVNLLAEALKLVFCVVMSLRVIVRGDPRSARSAVCRVRRERSLTVSSALLPQRDDPAGSWLSPPAPPSSVPWSGPSPPSSTSWTISSFSTSWLTCSPFVKYKPTDSRLQRCQPIVLAVFLLILGLPFVSGHGGALLQLCHTDHRSTFSNCSQVGGSISASLPSPSFEPVRQANGPIPGF